MNVVPSSSPGPIARPDAAVVADRVSVSYGERAVWTDATFEVAAGEFVAVIGPNGGGKTTLFRLLLGLKRPSSGDLRVLGSAPRRGSARIGYVPQRHTVDHETHVRALELVRLGRSGHRWGIPFAHRGDTEAAWRALEATGAEGLGDQPLGELSGGELQRVFLAEALASDPELLLLDEPLSNLDLRRAKELVALVARISAARGVAALLVAHDINTLIPYLNKVIYLANGNVAIGPPSTVLTSASLTRLYGVEVEVLRDSRGRIVIVGGEGHTEGEIVGGEDHHEGEATGGSFPKGGSGG